MQINYRVSSLSKDPKRRCPDTNKLEKLVGWKPRVSFEEGLKRTIGWFSQRKQAPLRGYLVFSWSFPWLVLVVYDSSACKSGREEFEG
jgi:hypothetical protein